MCSLYTSGDPNCLIFYLVLMIWEHFLVQNVNLFLLILSVSERHFQPTWVMSWFPLCQHKITHFKGTVQKTWRKPWTKNTDRRPSFLMYPLATVATKRKPPPATHREERQRESKWRCKYLMVRKSEVFFQYLAPWQKGKRVQSFVLWVKISLWVKILVIKGWIKNFFFQLKGPYMAGEDMPVITLDRPRLGHKPLPFYFFTILILIL